MTHVDFQSPSRYADYEELRGEGKVVWSAQHDAWLALGFDECDRVLKDADTFGSTNRRELFTDERWAELTSVLGGPRAMTLLPEEQHAPMVGQVRRRLASCIPRFLDSRIHPVVDHFMKGFVEGGRGDFAADFSDFVPPAVIASVLGLPWDDPDLLMKWKAWDAGTVEAASRFDRAADDEGRRAVAELFDVVRPIVEARRDQREDDFISQLWDFVPTILPECEVSDVLAQCRQLFLGGSHTSSFLMNNCAVLLFSEPDLWRQLKGNRESIGRFVEEVLRVIGVAQIRPRVVARDTELGGKSLRAGDRIYAVMAAANRDPSKYPCPFAVSLSEEDRRRHLAFGAGPKTCGGMSLARAEVADVLNTLFDCIDNPRLDPDQPPPAFTGDSFTSWRPVHVVFDDIRAA